MYNLLIKTGPWLAGHGVISLERVLTYTDEQLVTLYGRDATTDFNRLIELPALFVEESNRQVNQLAHVGVINRVRMSGRTVEIEYTFDAQMPVILQSDLVRLAPLLHIRLPHRGFTELETTHWAVKDVNLFRVLLGGLSVQTRVPQVFSLSNPQIVIQNQVSVMMPFAGFDAVYSAIVESCNDVNMQCNRADDIWENHAVIEDIVGLIDRSAVVVCDCSTRNSNVFYEIGIAHSLGKEVILISQAASDVPFDLAHLRYIRYLNNEQVLICTEN